MPPDPAMPGLLDLLTVQAVGEPLEGGADAPEPARDSIQRRPAPDRIGVGRLWVEVEV